MHVVNSTKSATIGRAQSFVQWDTQYFPFYPGNNISLNILVRPEVNQVFLPPTDMVTAMFNGMFPGASGPNTSAFSPNLSCPTGNCTFPPFKTLAVCSECKNITNALSKKCQPVEINYRGNPRMATAFCEFSLPNGLKMNKTFGPSTVAIKCSQHDSS